MLKVAICPDFREEGWRSMDRIAESLVEHLARDHGAAIRADLVAPAFRRRATRLGSSPRLFNVDRGLNRLWDYPRHARALGSRYDVFHVVDHSYSQLVHQLPAARTVVTCHDLDTFRSLVEPEQERRSEAFKAMTRHILQGIQRAACITCDTAAVRDELIAHRLVMPERVVVAPVGVDAVFSAMPDPEADRDAEGLLGPVSRGVDILHVGSTAPRKRIDMLLRIVASVRASRPDVRLVRVGGAFTREQEHLANELGLAGHVCALPALSDRSLAAVYRRAALLLLPSEREGFGLPVVEAMACGTPVLASDIAVLREVGGGVAEHCSPGDPTAWTERVLALIEERDRSPERWRDRSARGVAAARRFSWPAFAASMADIYIRLAQRSAARAQAPAIPARDGARAGLAR